MQLRWISKSISKYDPFFFFEKKTGSGISVNEQLAEELHKPVIKKFKKRKVYVRSKGKIWAVDLAKIGSLSSKNKNVNKVNKVNKVNNEVNKVNNVNNKAKPVLNVLLSKW